MATMSACSRRRCAAAARFCGPDSRRRAARRGRAVRGSSSADSRPTPAAGARVFAASSRSGSLRLAPWHPGQGWLSGPIASGLPIRDEQRLFHEVKDVSARVQTQGPPIVMAGGPVGVFRSRDGGATFHDASRTTFEDYVALPEGWLFASARHEVEVVSEEVI